MGTIREQIKKSVATLRKTGIETTPVIPGFGIKDFSRAQFIEFFQSVIDREFVWDDKYNDVIDWIRDNKRKGLFLCGDKGKGKSVITCRVLPLIFKIFHRKILRPIGSKEIVTPEVLEGISKKTIINIDDIGTEQVKYYGKDMTAVEYLCDLAEKQGKLLILTSNMTKGRLDAFYDDGERTTDRIKALTKPILFGGESLRK